MDQKLSFTDKTGMEWDLSIDLLDARTIDLSDYSAVTKLKFCFLTPEKEFFGEVFQNKSFAAALAWTIVQQDQLEKLDPEWATKSIDELELLWLKRLSGSAAREMHLTMLRAIADFFPEQQTALSNLLTKMEKVNQRLQMELESMDSEMDQLVDEEMEHAIAEVRSKMPERVKKLRGEISSRVSAD